MVKSTIAIAFLFSLSGCSASCSAGSTSGTNSPDGKPVASTDSDGGSGTKAVASGDASGSDADGSDSDPSGSAAGGDTPTALSTTPKTSAASADDPDCVPGVAAGHEKDKAKGEAKGHDKPPCPEDASKTASKGDAGKSETAKTDP